VYGAKDGVGAQGKYKHNEHPYEDRPDTASQICWAGWIGGSKVWHVVSSRYEQEYTFNAGGTLATERSTEYL
jgi:hypothetical protein